MTLSNSMASPGFLVARSLVLLCMLPGTFSFPHGGWRFPRILFARFLPAGPGQCGAPPLPPCPGAGCGTPPLPPCPGQCGAPPLPPCPGSCGAPPLPACPAPPRVPAVPLVPSPPAARPRTPSGLPPSAPKGSSPLPAQKPPASTPGGPGGSPSAPGGSPPGGVCGSDASSKSVIISASTDQRTVTTNGCPGYPWYVAGVSVNNAVAQPTTYTLPLRPTMNQNVLQVGVGSCVLGPIGVALNGVAFFSDCDAQNRDALVYEGASFDSCGGHASPMGQYHYHVLPGASNPGSISSTRNLNFAYCPYAFWKDAAGAHSPLIGFLADGIPIYGPRGAGGQVPADLDSCNGHDSDSPGFYHYHATSNAPYLVNCLKGCVSSSSWPRVATKACIPATKQYNYSSLSSVKAA